MCFRQYLSLSPTTRLRGMTDIKYFKLKNILLFLLSSMLGACATGQRVNGWYPVADVPENMIEGKAIVTTKDFDAVALDTTGFPGVARIDGILKPGKVRKWAEATESRIGKRIGFVFNDSVIMAPTVHCRIESGSFTINSPDKELIIRIYNSLIEK